MVIKSMSRKSPTFFQLIAYISREGRAEGPPVLHNLNADGQDPNKINRAFMQNAKGCPPRKNGVVLYHEILSLSPEDRPCATPEILAELAERYLSLRAPRAMAYGRVHFDQNPHIHLIISGNLRGQAKKLRLSRQAFSSVKRELEAYQKQHYPELSRSIVFDNAKEKAREVKEKKEASGKMIRKPSEQERKKRLVKQGRGVPSQKKSLRRHVIEALTGAGSPEIFTARLAQRNIRLYERGGRLAGIVENGKKYRFRTLDLEETLRKAQTRWEQVPKRRKTIRDILAEKARRVFREQGFARAMIDVLDRRGKGRGGDRERQKRIETVRSME
jgi:hypothetical protein